MTTRQILGRVLRQGWGYKWQMLSALVSAAVMGGLWGYAFLMLQQIVDLMARIQAAQTGQAGDLAETLTRMRYVAWQLIAVTPFMGGATYLAWYTGAKLANRCSQDLRNSFLGHLVRLDLGFHSQMVRGDLIARMTTDLITLQNIQTNLYGRLIQRPIEALALVVTLFVVNWQFAAVVFAGLLPVAAVIGVILRKTRRRSLAQRESYARTLNAFEQITAGVRVIKAMGSSEREETRFAGTNRALYDDSMRVARARAQSETVTNSALFLLTGGVLLLGAWLFSRNWITPAQLAAVFGILGRLTTVLREVQRVWGDTQVDFPSAERVYAVLDLPSRIDDRPTARPCPPPKSSIRLEGVCFRYAPDAEDVLRGIDLDLPVGRTVALVGKSGGGKSTILDLIPRFHDVTGGRVTWDGADVRDLTQASLVGHCAIVAQDSFLFNDTIYTNILYGRPEASRAQVETAARRAHLHDAILSLEGGLGYDTVVGDRGSRLSGGQRQRVAIARALLRDAPVLLLDEPTSALDADSEQHVQEALAELMRGRTTIVVAHRLATIQHADRIHVLAGAKDQDGKDDPRRGTIVESGTHHELIEKNGEYARLVRLQQLAG
jgi:subfamily B ATP-binding cassette protein MsbA